MRRSLVHRSSTLSPFLTRMVSRAASNRPLPMGSSNVLLGGSAAAARNGAAASASRNALLLMKGRAAPGVQSLQHCKFRLLKNTENALTQYQPLAGYVEMTLRIVSTWI